MTTPEGKDRRFFLQSAAAVAGAAGLYGLGVLSGREVGFPQKIQGRFY